MLKTFLKRRRGVENSFAKKSSRKCAAHRTDSQAIQLIAQKMISAIVLEDNFDFWL